MITASMSCLSDPPFIASTGAQARLRRLIDNLAGFVYQRRHDGRWTMEFISDACRDVTGYDAHRFVQNQSLAFADLIHPEDRVRVRTLIDAALKTRRRMALTYRIKAAHGGLVFVQDRLVGVYDEAGAVVAIEGIVDRVPIWSRTEPVSTASQPACHELRGFLNPSSSHLFFSSDEQA